MELIAVARVARPQGRRGEVRVEPLTDEPRRLSELAECYLVPPETGERRRVETVWFQNGVPVMKLAGVESLGDAEGLAGRLVTIPRTAARTLPPDHFYAFELLGCTVRDPAGTPLGSVTDVVRGEHHDLWVVKTGSREWLLPAVTAMVDRVDLAERVVVVRVPDGLCDLADG